MTISLYRLARNQAIFREVNERLREIANPAVPVTEYICECSDIECVETMELDAAEYEAVRAMPNTFVLVPGHERPEVERVIHDNDRFLLVEKVVAVDSVDLTAALGNRPWPSLGL